MNSHFQSKKLKNFTLNLCRDRSDFIDPWAPNQGPISGPNFGANLGGNMSNFGGGGSGANFNSLPNAPNQFGGSGFGGNGMPFGMNGNPNNLPNSSGNMNLNGNMSNGFGSGNGGGSGNGLGGGNFGGNPNMPVYSTNNNIGGGNGPNDEPKETTQVTIPKDVSFLAAMISVSYIRFIVLSVIL